jgi:hypothetical protein
MTERQIIEASIALLQLSIDDDITSSDADKKVAEALGMLKTIKDAD